MTAPMFPWRLWCSAISSVAGFQYVAALPNGVAERPRSAEPVTVLDLPLAPWRNVVAAGLIFVSLMLIVRAGTQVGMDRYLSPRYLSASHLLQMIRYRTS